MNRDIILTCDFNALTLQGLRRFCDDIDGHDSRLRTAMPETWAFLWFQLRAAEDRPEWFPSGKWTTLQRIEALLNECAAIDAARETVRTAAIKMLDDLDNATGPDEWSTSGLRAAIDAARESRPGGEEARIVQREAVLRASERVSSWPEWKRSMVLYRSHIQGISKTDHMGLLEKREPVQTLCPCCGNRAVCDCSTVQSSQFRRIAELEAALAQVDDVLIVNWITAEEGNYRKALHDLVQFNIQIENDPAVSETARVRANEIAELKRELAEERARLDKLFSMRSPLLVRNGNIVRLLETDCGAMIVRGEGKDERAAIDAAGEKDNTNA